MSSKIVEWLVGAGDGKVLGFKKKSGIMKKNPEKNQEMVNTKFLPPPALSHPSRGFQSSCRGP